MSLNDKKIQEIIDSKDAEIERLKKLIEAERKTLRETLHEERDYYENILACMPGLVYWLNNENVYLGCNDTLAQTIGLTSKKEIIGKTNDEMPWKDQAEEMNHFNTMIMDSGQADSKEESSIFEGVYKTFISEKIPLFNKKKKVIGLVGHLVASF